VEVVHALGCLSNHLAVVFLTEKEAGVSIRGKAHA